MNAEQWQLLAFWLADCPYFPTARLGGAVRTADCNPPIASPILSTGHKCERKLVGLAGPVIPLQHIGKRRVQNLSYSLHF